MAVYTTTDNRQYVVRPIQGIDREHLVAGLGKMSPTTRYHRFLTARTDFTDEELDFLISCDGKDHIAYVCRALEANGQEGEGVAVARFFRDPNNREWGEVAIVVIDAWQEVGLGSILLGTLAKQCRTTGAKGWRATLLGENERAAHLFAKVGKVVMREWEYRSLVLHIRLN